MFLLIVNKQNKAKKLPVTVIGTPVNTPLNSLALYRANLKAPQIGNNNSGIIPNILEGLSV